MKESFIYTYSHCCYPPERHTETHTGNPFPLTINFGVILLVVVLGIIINILICSSLVWILCNCLLNQIGNKIKMHLYSLVFTYIVTFTGGLYFELLSFISVWRTPFSISHRAALLANSYLLFYQGKSWFFYFWMFCQV